jgi:hypothetical protein
VHDVYYILLIMIQTEYFVTYDMNNSRGGMGNWWAFPFKKFRQKAIDFKPLWKHCKNITSYLKKMSDM